jgi:homogentisate phytyltransferase/homogentisate geranylgeranyltransferase
MTQQQSVPAGSVPPETPFWQALWQFSRPHTVVGTTASVGGVAALAIALGSPGVDPATLLTWPPLLGAIALTWVACLCGNVYIVGLNQLEDVAIDRINKPQLPLAAGTLTLAQGRTIVASTGMAAVGLGAIAGPWLLAVVLASLAIGTAYSLPPIRLKRFPLWASGCILVVRGLVVNVGLFWHFATPRHWPPTFAALPPALGLLTGFTVIFAIAIALLKDIPDMEGDRQYNIATFTLRLGAIAVFRGAVGLLALAYGGAIAAVALGLPGLDLGMMLLTHGGAIAVLAWGYVRTDCTEAIAMTRFYQLIWKLFVWEYAAFALTAAVA